MTEHRRADRLRPDQRFGIGALAFASSDQRSHGDGEFRGLRAQAPSTVAAISDRRCRSLFGATRRNASSAASRLLARSAVCRVAERADSGLAQQVERIFDPGHASADPITGRLAISAQALPKCDQMARKIAAVDRGDIFRLQRTQIARVVPIVEMAAEALQLAIESSVASSRSTVSSVPIQPKSRAATTDSRYSPRLVGEVRWATTGWGSS